MFNSKKKNAEDEIIIIDPNITVSVLNMFFKEYLYHNYNTVPE